MKLQCTAEEAERIQHGLSDMLCWCAGYKAGNPDLDAHPMGIEEVRRIRLLLNRAIEKENTDGNNT